MEETNFLIYKTDDNKVEVNVRMEEDTVWLTIDQMAELFDRGKSTISRHISNIFEEGELDKISVVAKNATTASDGKTYQVDFYNLDVIISVGYRVKSLRGTQFRQWATKRLNEYIRKGFTMDDERMKELGGGMYFKELLERIRDIRSSEKVLYRQVLDLYATSIDYDPNSPETTELFKIIQNKLHYAAHGHTAAEMIYSRADSEAPFMGLTSFTGDFPRLKDAKIAKNYLKADELKVMNNLVSGYFDFAEIRAIEHHPTRMKDYVEQLDKILSLNRRKLLDNPGKISHEQAMKKAEREYRKYEVKNLSPIEQEYLKSIEKLAQKANHPDL